MSSTAESLLCRGMRDRLPAEMARFRRIESAFREVCAAWGYGEVRTPTLEHLHLFTSSGTLSPQLLGRVYSFLDWDGWTGERVVLRPDATIPVARLFRERLGGGVAKLCYVQNIFRFSRDEQPRELWQCGAELIGNTWPAGDVELVLVALDSLTALGIADAAITLSHGGIVRALLEQAGYTADERSDLYDRLLDGDLDVMRELEARLPALGPGLRLLSDVEDAGVAYIGNLRAAFGDSVPAMNSPLDELELIGRTLELAGIEPRINATALRDFEYYTGPVFHLSLGGSEIAAGGRYDRLISDAGGTAVPACGFGLQADRLAALLGDAGSDAAECLAIAPDGPGAEALARAAAVARLAHRQGRPAALAPGDPAAPRLSVAADGELALVGGSGSRLAVASLAEALGLLAGSA